MELARYRWGWKTFRRTQRYSPSWQDEAGRTTISESWQERISSACSLRLNRSLRGCRRSKRARSARLQNFRKLSWQFARANAAHGFVNVVGHAHELDAGFCVF